MEQTIRTIDWSAAWAAAQTESRTRRKPYRDPSFWNKRAKGFADHQQHKSDYPAQFIRMLDLKPGWTILDAGCGPGTLALPLAARGFRVTAMDFSENMLAILRERAREHHLSGIETMLSSLEDPWEDSGIGRHDVVIASRSLVVKDLAGLLQKLTQFAKHKVIVSAMVGHGPFDQRIIDAAGRTRSPGPDYIYVLNQLYCMGIHARLDFTVHPVNRTYENHEDALEESLWMIDDITPEEEDRLRRFFANHLEKKGDVWFLPQKEPVRWAVISWDTDRVNMPCGFGEEIKDAR